MVVSDLNGLVSDLREQAKRERDSSEYYGSERMANMLDQSADAIESLRRDGERYRWLREHKCNSLHLSLDGDHACNYMTAADYIDHHMNKEEFADVESGELQRMKDTNTIWRLQIYPDTPIGFYVWHGATLDAAIDAAIKQTGVE